MARRRNVLLVAALATLVPAVPAAAAQRVPDLTVRPASALTVPFRWDVSDYALRCEGRAVRIVADAGEWRARLNDGAARRGRFTARIPASGGRRTILTFRRGSRSRRFHFRCLPPDFPWYRFKRLRPGGPEFLFMQLKRHYAAIFDRDGTPIWWYRAAGIAHNFKLLRNGTLALSPGSAGGREFREYELRTLGGRLIRTVAPPDGEIDVHEILVLNNGNFLLARRVQRLMATSPEGPVLATVIDFDIEEVTPGGAVVWRWSAGDHIDPSEAGRWWQESNLSAPPYDVYHWNAADVRGDVVLLTFRHLDAVYAVSRSTGEILWKLGGTPTPQSLRVIGDPQGDFPLGGPHDARFLANGTISVYDNRLEVAGRPRVVRYRIDPKAGTARLIRSFSDRAVERSFCCGSARLLGRTWLVGWGGWPLVAAYDRLDRRVFTLRTPTYGYRANYATADQLKIGAVRRGMDALARRGTAG